MASSFLSPAQINLIDFFDTCKYQTHLFKIQGGFSLKRKDVNKVTIGKGIRCSASVPPAWPGSVPVDDITKSISYDGPKPISIIGSTGSIGSKTLSIVAEHSDKFRVVALAAGSNFSLLAEQAKQFKPQLISLRNESLVGELKEALAGADYMPEIVVGEEGTDAVASHPDAAMMVSCIVGCAGLQPTVAAIKAGKNISLVNKETLIAGAPYILPLAQKHNVKIVPADSEHAAIFQCIQGWPEGALRRLILTASGGAFRDLPIEKLKDVRAAEINHPLLSLGKKVTIDTATLFNKGLEVIEAHYLFGIDYDNIEILIHREGIINSMVEAKDSSVLAQLSLPDMRVPTIYTLSWPERVECSELTWPRLDLAKIGSFTFKEPDNKKYPSMNLCYAAGRAGGTMTGVISAANEQAVQMFIEEKISYLDLFKVVELTCDKHQSELVASPSLEEILHYDLWARDYAASLTSSLAVV